MNKSENELRRHLLYPDHKSDQFGFWHNDEPFFKRLTPEDAEKLLLLQSHEEFIDWENKKIPVLKGCCEGTLWGNKAEDHSKCISIIASNSAEWDIFETCRFEDMAELFDEMKAMYVAPRRYAAIQKIIDTAPRSSLYENPFSGFDNPDKVRAPLEWLVEDMFPARSLNAIVGVSDSLKSFFAIHLACCIATGMQFFGKEVLQGPVLFLAPEGGEGVPKRWGSMDGRERLARLLYPVLYPGGIIQF